jgi:DNA-directed RNA polymerase subunit RPC12/RpoP
MYGEVSNKHRCLMCGKEWTVPEPAVQHYFLCRDCTGHWLIASFQQFKARIARWLGRKPN